MRAETASGLWATRNVCMEPCQPSKSLAELSHWPLKRGQLKPQHHELHEEEEEEIHYVHTASKGA